MYNSDPKMILFPPTNISKEIKLVEIRLHNDFPENETMKVTCIDEFDEREDHIVENREDLEDLYVNGQSLDDILKEAYYENSDYKANMN